MDTLTMELQEIILSYVADVDTRTVVNYILMYKISLSIYKKNTFWKQNLEKTSSVLLSI